MTGEERLAVNLEVLLVGVEHAVEPREEFLGAVVSVQDDRNAVDGGDTADVVGTGDGTSDRGLLLVVGSTLTGEVGSTTVGDLEDDGALLVTSSLEGGDGGRRGGDVLG